MGWLSSIGSKLTGAQRFGSKLLSSVGSIGQKLSSKAGGALDMLQQVPVAGQLVSRIPGYSTLRGVISGAGSLGRIASTAGQVLEKPVTSVKDAVGVGKNLRGLGGQTVAEIQTMRRGVDSG